MTWTKTKPTEPGWYWVRMTDDNGRRYGPEIHCFELSRHNLNPAAPEPIDGPWSREGWEWFAGPIPEPEKPAK